jgi:hypothetical protein
MDVFEIIRKNKSIYQAIEEDKEERSIIKN